MLLSFKLTNYKDAFKICIGFSLDQLAETMKFIKSYGFNGFEKLSKNFSEQEVIEIIENFNILSEYYRTHGKENTLKCLGQNNYLDIMKVSLAQKGGLFL